MEDENAKYNRLIELSVIEQCQNIIKTAAVQQSYMDNGYPIVHAWCFDLHDGLLKDLNFDFDKSLKKIQKIYNLATEKPVVDVTEQAAEGH